MVPSLILTVWIILYGIHQGWEAFLTYLNLRFNARHKEVPEEISNKIDNKTLITSQKYLKQQSNLSLLNGFIQSIITLTVISTGFLGIVETFIYNFLLSIKISSPSFFSVVFVLALLTASNVISIPFTIYKQFIIEKRFGFNKTTPKIFIFDLIKSYLITLILGIPLLSGIFWLITSQNQFWWLYCFIVITLFQLILTFLYQPLIAPLFNKFKELTDETLHHRLFSLSKKLKFNIGSILIMDGSQRSTHTNAYFTGFGKAKRIVLFDTLLNLLEEDQLEAVLAHEIGHQKRYHVIKRIILNLILTFLGFWLMSFLFQQPELFLAFGFNDVGFGVATPHSLIITLSLVAGPTLFILNPLFTGWSRRHEYEADQFAVSATNNSKAMEDALLKLSIDNLSNIYPHPWYSAYHYSHPTLLERIRAIRQYANI